MVLPDFALSRPSTVDEAVGRLAEGGVPYAGGTELVAAMLIGLAYPAELVDIKGVDGLSGVSVGPTEVVIGTATRHIDLADSPTLRQVCPILAQACSSLGNQRVRATGTVGGNICFADPRSDVNTVLFAMQAEVSLVSEESARRLPIADFVLGAMDTDLREGELLTAVHVPVQKTRQVYLRHQPAEYPTVCTAAVAGEGSGEPFVRVALGAVGDRPQLLEGSARSDLDVPGFVAEMDVAEDLNGSDEYKRHLSHVFIERVLDELKGLAHGRE